MLRKVLVFGAALTLAGGLVWATEPPAAQKKDEKPEAKKEAAAPKYLKMGWGVRAGYLKGGQLTSQAVGFPVPLPDYASMKDTFFLGGIFYNQLLPALRFEARANFAPAKFDHVNRVDIPVEEGQPAQYKDEGKDVTIFYLDVAFVKQFPLGGNWELGVPFGLGWTYTRASGKFAPNGCWVNRNMGVDFSPRSGLSYFLGARATKKLQSQKTLFFEARAVRFHRFVNVNARTLKSIEVSTGMTFAFKNKAKPAA